ncbi:MAG: hypothetical protein ACOCZ5_03085 [bacterium]
MYFKVEVFDEFAYEFIVDWNEFDLMQRAMDFYSEIDFEVLLEDAEFLEVNPLELINNDGVLGEVFYELGIISPNQEINWIEVDFKEW